MTDRVISHDDAKQIAQRLINSHFRKDDHARVSIPARPDYDDDLLIMTFIEQQRDLLAELGAIASKAIALSDAMHFDDQAEKLVGRSAQRFAELCDLAKAYRGRLLGEIQRLGQEIEGEEG